jgi:hypothetical protein
MEVREVKIISQRWKRNTGDRREGDKNMKRTQ